MRISIRIDPPTGERYLAVPVKGKELLLDPLLNKGSAFTAREREDLDLEGLLPPAISTMKQQLERAYENFQSHPTPLSRHIFLTSLQDRNEVLFYRLLDEHIEEMMPIVYTPVVGEACQKFSHIYRKSRGVYITYEQKERIEQILINTGLRSPSIIVVTDGERILGLGDQGAGGMGIPMGKLCLYTLCAGLSPYSTLPVLLDVGTDNEERLNDPLYLGTRHRRIRGAEYQDFVDAFVAAVQRVFPNVVLQWEDFLKGNAIHQLKRFRDTLCTFNDDIQGTAGVVVAGLLSTLRITGQSMADQRVLFAGAGAAAQGISDLIVAAMMEAGLSRTEAARQIYTVDSRGLVTKDRTGLEEFKARLRPGRRGGSELGRPGSLANQPGRSRQTRTPDGSPGRLGSPRDLHGEGDPTSCRSSTSVRSSSRCPIPQRRRNVRRRRPSSGPRVAPLSQRGVRSPPSRTGADNSGSGRGTTRSSSPA